MSKCITCGSEKIVGINAKCNDMCMLELSNGSWLDGYVPDDMNIGGGDYINFDYCLDCGQIQDDFPVEKI